MQGDTPMEYLLRLLKESNWLHEHKFDSKGKLELLFFAHPGSVALARRYHHVAIIDATYKTNQHNYPLLHAVSQVATNCSFSVAFCFMRDETDSSYRWAIEKLKSVISCLGAVYHSNTNFSFFSGLSGTQTECPKCLSQTESKHYAMPSSFTSPIRS